MKKAVLTIGLFFAATIYAISQTNASYDSNAVNIAGPNNSAFGVGVLKVNSSYDNTGVGYQALFSNTTGRGNTAIGSGALYSSTTGEWNAANGLNALRENTSGFHNTAMGAQTLNLNTTGGENTALGFRALSFNVSGYGNTATGKECLVFNLGNLNTANGFNALAYNTSGSLNTAMGESALLNNTTGSNNVSIGDSSGLNNTGSNNIYIGKRAGFYETGNNKLYVGNDSNKTTMYADMSTGQVLLGNKKPFGYTFKGMRTLNVVGGILTDSIRIGPSNSWADYIFEEDFQLQPLADLESFIKAYGHLPNIPSAQEVATNGIELRSMDTKLLEKIEELTLYILQQQKQIQLQQTANDNLKSQIEIEKKNFEMLRNEVEALKLSKE